MILGVILLFVSVQAEIQINGRLVDERNQPLPFANIGILNESVGTTSLLDGSFKLVIPDKFKDREVIFSSLGYERKSFSISELILMKNIKITLREQATVLKEVEVVKKKSKFKKSLIGPNPAENLRYNFNSRDQNGGAVVAILIDPQPRKFFLNKIRLNIADNNWLEAKFRIRLLKQSDSTKLPGTDLIEHNIISDCSIKKGWLVVDLTQHNISLDIDKFFLGIELIEDATIRELQDAEDSLRQVHYRKLFEKGEKGIREIKKTIDGNEVVTGYIAENRGVKTLIKSMKEAGIESSPRTNFRVTAKWAERYPCYSKAASFDKWRLQPFTLVSKVLIEYSK